MKPTIHTEVVREVKLVDVEKIVYRIPDSELVNLNHAWKLPELKLTDTEVLKVVRSFQNDYSDWIVTNSWVYGEKHDIVIETTTKTSNQRIRLYLYKVTATDIDSIRFSEPISLDLDKKWNKIFHSLIVKDYVKLRNEYVAGELKKKESLTNGIDDLCSKEQKRDDKLDKLI